MRARRRAWAHRWEVIRAAPAALQAQPAWQTATRARLAAVRYRLAVAWPMLQAGDPAPWREAIASLDATIRDAQARRARGHSDGGICDRLGI